MESNNKKCVCAKNLGTQPPLEHCVSQLNFPVYHRELWEDGHEISGSLRT